MNAGTQVKSPQAADVVFDVLIQPGANFVQRLLVIRDAGSQDQILLYFFSTDTFEIFS